MECEMTGKCMSDAEKKISTKESLSNKGEKGKNEGEERKKGRRGRRDMN